MYNIGIHSTLGIYLHNDIFRYMIREITQDISRLSGFIFTLVVKYFAISHSDSCNTYYVYIYYIIYIYIAIYIYIIIRMIAVQFFIAGDEYGFVILSMVRSKPKAKMQHFHQVCHDRKWQNENLGFVTDRHRINVAITRSKYGLVIVGKTMDYIIVGDTCNLVYFMTLGNQKMLSFDKTWESLIQYYQNKGCVVDGNNFV